MLKSHAVHASLGQVHCIVYEQHSRKDMNESLRSNEAQVSSAYQITSTSINDLNEKHEQEVCESHLQQMTIKDERLERIQTEPEQVCF